MNIRRLRFFEIQFSHKFVQSESATTSPFLSTPLFGNIKKLLTLLLLPSFVFLIHTLSNCFHCTTERKQLQRNYSVRTLLGCINAYSPDRPSLYRTATGRPVVLLTTPVIQRLKTHFTLEFMLRMHYGIIPIPKLLRIVVGAKERPCIRSGRQGIKRDSVS